MADMGHRRGAVSAAVVAGVICAAVVTQVVRDDDPSAEPPQAGSSTAVPADGAGPVAPEEVAGESLVSSSGPIPVMPDCIVDGVAWPPPPGPTTATLVDRAAHLPTDTTGVLVLVVDFDDAPVTDNALALAQNQAELAQELARDISHDAWTPTIAVHDEVVRLDRPLSHYADPAFVGDEGGLLWFEALEDALAVIDDDVDFSAVDTVVVHAPTSTVTPGPPAEANDVGIADPRLRTAEGGIGPWIYLDPTAMTSEILIHEVLHTLGLPDLYEAINDTDLFVHTGGWDLMANVVGQGPTLFAWQQWQLGWVTDQQMGCLASPGRHEAVLAPIADPRDELAGVVVPTGPTSGLVVENRRPLRADAYSCSSGVLVYRVDVSGEQGDGTSGLSSEAPIRVVSMTDDEGYDDLGCGNADRATLGAPGSPSGQASSWTDPVSGVTVEVLAATDRQDLVAITRP